MNHKYRRQIVRLLLLVGVVNLCNIACNTKEVTIYSTYESGSLKLIGDKIDDSKECYTSYYEKGGIRATFCTIDSAYDGEYLAYYPTGVLELKETFRLGLRVDTTFQFYENGVLKSKQAQANGKRHGEYVEYDSLTREIEYRYIEHGIRYYQRITTYDSMGTPWFTEKMKPIVTRLAGTNDVPCVQIRMPFAKSQVTSADVEFLLRVNQRILPTQRVLEEPKTTLGFTNLVSKSYCLTDFGLADSAIIYGAIYMISGSKDTSFLTSFQELIKIAKIGSGNM